MQEKDIALAAAADAHEALAANYAGLLASAHAAKLGLDAACAHHAPVLAADETRVRNGKAPNCATMQLCQGLVERVSASHKHTPLLIRVPALCRNFLSTPCTRLPCISRPATPFKTLGQCFSKVTVRTTAVNVKVAAARRGRCAAQERRWLLRCAGCCRRPRPPRAPGRWSWG